MKRIFFTIVCLAAVSGLRAGGTEPVGRERTGMGLIPFSSAAAALSGDVAASPFYRLPEGGVVIQKDSHELTGDYKVPFAWVDRQVFLHVEGASSPYKVLINGTETAYNPSPRVGADFDVTKLSKEGNNAFSIIFDMPQYVAHVRIYAFSQPRVRIRDVVAETSFGEGDAGLLDLGVILKSHLLNPKEYEVYYELFDPQGNSVASGHKPARFRMKQEDTVSFFANIPHIQPWSDERPNLYTLQLKTQYEGRFGEYTALRIGFRTVGMSNGRLVVNGVPVAINALTLKPVSDVAQMAEKLREAKLNRYNMIRLVDAPASSEFYQLCDMLGLYVCDQAGLPLADANNPDREQLYIDRVMTMYDASKNHPSVVMFALSDIDENGYNLYEAYLALKRREKVRPISFDGAHGQWNSDTATDGNNGRIKVAATEKPHYFGPFAFRTWAGDQVTVHNLMVRTPIDKLRFRVTNAKDKVVAEGYVDTDIAPGATQQLTIPLGKVKLTEKHKMWLALPGPLPTFMPSGGEIEKLLPVPSETWISISETKN